MQQSSNHEHDRVLILACRSGSLPDAERLVARYQDTVVRVGFLLTGDNQEAVQLASNAFLDLFAELRTSDEDRDVRRWLLTKLIDCFLVADRFDSLPDENMLPGSTAVSHFHVETDRSRTRAALLGLEDRSRAVLVLAEYSLLTVTEITTVIDDDRETVPATLERAIQRLTVNLDLNSERTLRGVLAEAAFDTPRVNLWPDMQDAVEENFMRERLRSRLINLVAGGVGIMLLLIAGMFLVGEFFSSSDETPPGSAPAATIARGQADASAGEGSSVATRPVSVPTSDVADVLLLTSYQGNNPETSIVQSGENITGSLLLPESDGGIRQAAVPLVSPDGNLVVLIYYEFEIDMVTGYLAAYDGHLATMHWRIPVTQASHAGSPDDKPPFLMTAAVDDRRIYVAVQYWNEQRPVEIMIFEQKTGQQIQRISTNLAGFSSHDVRIFSPPDDDTVYLFAITQDQPPLQGQLGMVYLAYKVPSGRQVHGRSLADLIDSRIFFIYNSSYTPDGEHLYGLLYTRDRQENAVHFFNLQEGIVEPEVSIPFQPVTDPLPIQQATSHDGRLLYVLSPLTREMAIVDLEHQRLQSMVPLDMGFLAQQPVDLIFFPDSPMQLSPNGRWLYAIGVTSGSDTERRSGVWVIDTATMSVAGHWLTEAEPRELLLSGDGSSLYVRDEQPSGADDRLGGFWIINAETGFVQAYTPFEEFNSSLTSLAGLYSSVFGTSPAIDGAQPVDTPISSLLAGLQVSVEGQELDLGDRTVIDVQFVNPLTGLAIEPDGTGVRYQQPSAVQAIFKLEDGDDDIILELGATSFGRYRGVVSLPGSGDWSIRVVARWDGRSRDALSRVVPGGVTVESLVATNPGSSPGISNQFRAR